MSDLTPDSHMTEQENADYRTWLRTATRAPELPDIRLWMLDEWRDETSLLSIQANAGDKAITPEFDFKALVHARLYFVTTDISHMIERRSLDCEPDGMVLTDELVPSPYGLVYFQEPLRSPSIEDQEDDDAGPKRRSDSPPPEERIRAFVWGPVDREGREMSGISGIRISPYIEATMYTGHRVMLAEPSVFWNWNDNVTEDRYDGGEYGEEVRRRLGTFWKVMDSPRIVEEIICRPARATRRRSERRRLDLDSNVLIIDLHAPRYRSSKITDESLTEEDGGKHAYSVRFPVEAFWRWQPHGPNNSLRRYQLIPEFIKGPEGAPYREKERVYRLRKKNMDTRGD